MGLDIYLATAEDAEWNRAYNQASEELYTEGPDGKTPRDKMSDEEYAAWRELYSYKPHQGVPSEQHPDHLFNRRYLRSSYNGGGFNHAVPEMLGQADGETYPDQRGSLYWIFAPMGREWDGDEGVLTAEDIDKLRASKARALEVADELRKCDRLRVITITPNMFGQPPQIDDDGALRTYRKRLEGTASRPLEPGNWYSTEGGNLNVYGSDGLTILAAIPGIGAFNIPGVHLIYRAGGEGFDSYIQSAEIVAEFCDEAIALIDRDGSCEMSWSG
jgi:hypothetical protein